MSHSEEETFNHAMQLISTATLPKALLNAIKLKVLETMAEAGPDARLSAQEIARRLSISNPNAPSMLDRMLRSLASNSIVTCSQQVHDSTPVRVYGLAPVAKHFIPNEDGASLGSLLEMNQDHSSFDTWSKLQDSVLEGGTPIERLHGTGRFKQTALDDKINAIFNKAMVDTSVILVKDMLKCYHGFNNLKSLVDVGGGLGITLNMIVTQYPTIKGVNFDLPQVIKQAPLYPGIEHVGGDMFQNVPKGDAIFMKWILHGWSDDDCVKLLKKCYNTLPRDGKVIIVEKIIPFIPDTSYLTRAITDLDLTMMTHTTGGKERTEDEFQSLAKLAGFREMKKMCFVSTCWVMEFNK
ncbi:caffeic acid 3-O-methyltransferase 1-like [Bidens hawaiensis]|uniref:caffeic acid 3-O-methyltransferase 1-like n=1 Tax=Bidens hawaiensis TaxID=980011 RepID=UPI0040490D23